MASAAAALVVTEDNNIDAAAFEQLASTMPLISVCLDALDRTWREFQSISTGFIFRRLLNKKHPPLIDSTSSCFQSSNNNSGDSSMRDNQISQKTIVTADSASSKSYVKKTLSDSYDHQQETVAPPRTYFKEDVSLHCKPNDCWLVIKDKVLSFLSAGFLYSNPTVLTFCWWL